MTGVCAASDFMTLTRKKITTIETRDKYKRTIMKFSTSEVTGTHNHGASGATPTGRCSGAAPSAFEGLAHCTEQFPNPSSSFSQSTQTCCHSRSRTQPWPKIYCLLSHLTQSDASSPLPISVTSGKNPHSPTYRFSFYRTIFYLFVSFVHHVHIK